MRFVYWFAIALSVGLNVTLVARILEYRKLLTKFERLCEATTAELRRVVEEYLEFATSVKNKLEKFV